MIKINNLATFFSIVLLLFIIVLFNITKAIYSYYFWWQYFFQESIEIFYVRIILIILFIFQLLFYLLRLKSSFLYLSLFLVVEEFIDVYFLLKRIIISFDNTYLQLLFLSTLYICSTLFIIRREWCKH